MPTDLQRVIAHAMKEEADAKFFPTLAFASLALCAINILVATESPLYAAALICTAR